MVRLKTNARRGRRVLTNVDDLVLRSCRAAAGFESLGVGAKLAELAARNRVKVCGLAGELEGRETEGPGRDGDGSPSHCGGGAIVGSKILGHDGVKTSAYPMEMEPSLGDGRALETDLDVETKIDAVAGSDWFPCARLQQWAADLADLDAQVWIKRAMVRATQQIAQCLAASDSSWLLRR